MNKPIAVLISDIHFSEPNLELASGSLVCALNKSDSLDVPLIIAGDLLDGKGNIKATCANRILSLLRHHTKNSDQDVYVLIGNHDLINEKGQEHALNFLSSRCFVVDEPKTLNLNGVKVMLIPYQSDVEKLRGFLHVDSLPNILRDEEFPKTLIMHQGVFGANMGHYVQDKTSLPKDCFSDFRVISGHYHRAQDIKCGRQRKGHVGLFSYIGSPYTTSFSEANDGPKGFRVLYEDGSLELIPTNLRKHIIIERCIDSVNTPVDKVNPGDLIWLKVSGPRLELDKIKKKELGMKLFGHTNFKLDKIVTDAPIQAINTEKLTGEQILDTLIDSTNEQTDNKVYLKGLWREVL